jgi:hypothetical protein
VGQKENAPFGAVASCVAFGGETAAGS